MGSPILAPVSAEPIAVLAVVLIVVGCCLVVCALWPLFRRFHWGRR